MSYPITLKALGLATLFLAVPAWVWDRSPIALGWVALWLGTAALIRAFPMRRRRSGQALALSGWTMIAFFALEFGLEARQPLKPVDSESKLFQPDANLGYRQLPNHSGPHVKTYDGEVIFEVDYSTNAHGWRTVPKASEAHGAPRILCLGGSFMAGYGLEDSQAVPAQVQALLGATAQVQSVAVRGWGPHQLLAWVESNGPSASDEADPAAAIYWAIPDHVRRARGASSWDMGGPRYRLGSQGEPVRDGNFDDPGAQGDVRDPLPASLHSLRKRSSLLRHLFPPLNPPPGPSKDAWRDGDLDLWVGLVAKLRSELKSRYPALRFLAVVHSSPGDGAEQMLERLEALGIETLDTAAVLPSDGTSDLQWSLHPKDLHPNREAAARIAAAIVGWL